MREDVVERGRSDCEQRDPDWLTANLPGLASFALLCAVDPRRFKRTVLPARIGQSRPSALRKRKDERFAGLATHRSAAIRSNTCGWRLLSSALSRLNVAGRAMRAQQGKAVDAPLRAQWKRLQNEAGIIAGDEKRFHFPSASPTLRAAGNSLISNLSEAFPRL